MMSAMRHGRVVVAALVLGWAALAGAQPANDDCADATVIGSLPFADAVDMTTATTEAGDPVSACSGQGTNSVWYRLPAADAASLFRGEAGGTGTRFSVRAFTGACGALTEIWCDLTTPSAPEFGLPPEGQEVLLEVVNTQTVGTLDFSLAKADEFLVQKGGLRTTAVAGGPNGFLAVWESGPSQAQLFDRSGAPIGVPFDLGAPAPDVTDPSVAAAGDGSYFVVWAGASPQAVRVDGPGVVVPLPLVSTTGDYLGVAADSTGNFVVVWGGVSAQRFDRDGAPLGGSFEVNTYTTGAQYRPSVAMTPTGEFVVAWEGPKPGGGDDISARLFDASGTPTTGEFVVNSSTAYGQYLASTAMDAAGNFVVAFEAAYFYGPPALENPVELRRFDAAGTPLGPDFIVTTEEYYISGHIHVASAANGEFMVSWETYDTNHSSFVDNAARRFDPDGTPQGPQFFAGNFGGYAHYDPSVGATPKGDFLIVWNDYRGFFNGAVPGTPEDAIIGRAFPASSGCATAALAGCRTPTAPLKARLLLKDEPDDIRDQLRWKFVKGAATDPADLGDPTDDEDYVLCMYDASSVAGALLMENQIPAGGTCGTKPCWKGLGNPPGSKGYRYKNRDRTPHGILKLVLKPGAEGKSKAILKGGQDLVFMATPGAPPLPLPLPVTVQLQNRSGECWQATFDSGGVGVNETGFYKGSGS